MAVGVNKFTFVSSGDGSLVILNDNADLRILYGRHIERYWEVSFQARMNRMLILSINTDLWIRRSRQHSPHSLIQVAWGCG